MSNLPTKKPNKAGLMRQWLAIKEKVMDDETGVLKRLTQLDLIMLAQIQKAKKGDTQAYKAIMETAFPQVKEPDIILNLNPAEMNDEQLQTAMHNLQTIHQTYQEQQDSGDDYAAFEDVSDATKVQSE